jgi:hypothetical protein
VVNEIVHHGENQIAIFTMLSPKIADFALAAKLYRRRWSN